MEFGPQKVAQILRSQAQNWLKKATVTPFQWLCMRLEAYNHMDLGLCMHLGVHNSEKES